MGAVLILHYEDAKGPGARGQGAEVISKRHGINPKPQTLNAKHSLLALNTKY